MSAHITLVPTAYAPVRRRGLRTAVAAALVAAAPLGLLGTTAAHAATIPVPESMPVWRLQVKVTTGADGTASRPAVRLNGTTAGVTNLNTWDAGAFSAGRVDTTYDLGLVGKVSDITMLRVGVPGTDTWCVQRVKLLINERLAFDAPAANGSGCVTISGGSYVEWSSAALRANPTWQAYGAAPARPTSMPFLSFCERNLAAIGSAMGPNVHWDRSVPTAFYRINSTLVQVNYGVVDKTGSPIESPTAYRLTYGVWLSGGATARATRSGSVLSGEGTMPTSAVAQLDAALQRMTTDPLAAPTLTATYDSARNVTWTRSALAVAA